MRSPAVGVLVLLLTQNLLPQTPPTAASVPAVVEGVIVNLANGEPIERAVVELRRTPQSRTVATLPAQPNTEAAALVRLLESGGPLPPQLTSDPAFLMMLQAAGLPVPGALTVTTLVDGKFSIKNVPPGEYRLYVTHGATFVPAEYGQRNPVGVGTPLTFASGQTVSGIRLAMAPTGTIGGRIVDGDGDPVPYVGVNLLRSAYQDGKRIFVIARSATTDDRGEYRLSSLSPGRYTIATRTLEARSTRWSPNSEPTLLPNRFAMQQLAGSPLVTNRVLDTGDVIEETWRPIYYPGTPDLQSAEPITLGVGENRRVVDISQAGSGVPSHHVRGVVIHAATGVPVMGATVRMVSQDSPGPVIIMPSGTTNSMGHFDLNGVLPRMYSLIVTGPVTGYMSLSVGNVDLDGITINGLTGVDIPWRATIEGSPDEKTAASRLRITLTRDPAIVGAPSGVTVTTIGWPGVPPGTVTPPIQAGPTGGFLLRNVALGDYRVSISGLPQDTYIKSISMGATDALRDGLHLAGVPENPLEIVIGNNTGNVVGRIVNAKQEPEVGVTVVLVPSPLLRFRSDLYQNVMTDGSGRFRFSGVVPGEYTLFAWEEVQDSAWRNADFLREQQSRGVPVNVNQGMNETPDVRVIPWSIGQ